MMLQGSALEVMQVSPLGCSAWEKHPRSLSRCSSNAAVLTTSTQGALGRFPAVVAIRPLHNACHRVSTPLRVVMLLKDEFDFLRGVESQVFCRKGRVRR